MKPNEKKFKDDAEYFADMEYVSQSHLKDFFTCEYFYESKYISKTFIDEEERDYFIYGSGVDALLTEKAGTFEQKFFPLPAGMKKIDTSEADNIVTALSELDKEIAEKEAAEKPFKALEKRRTSMREKLEMIESLYGKVQISNTVYNHIKQSAEELLRQPLYQMFGVGEAGMSQEIITLTIDGIKRKGKFDYLNIKKHIIADVKTCANIERFNPRDYANQLAYYRRLASEKYGIDKNEWDHYLLVVDKQTEVKRSKIMCLAKNIIDEAENEIEGNLRTYVERKDSGFYTPITETVTDYAESEQIREKVCFKCGHYNNCPFSLQKEIEYIT
jgi:hypothetical protein